LLFTFVDFEGSEIKKQFSEVFALLFIIGQDAQGEMHERSSTCVERAK